MDAVDAKLLNMLQKGLPACEYPFREIAALAGISEQECLDRIRRLKETGIIRRLGGVFNSPQMGIKSTLCAMRVPENDVQRLAEIVNSYPEVTHNYVRNNSYNMWFTISAKSAQSLSTILNDISRRADLPVVSMPVRKTYKIKVVLPIKHDT